MRTRNFPLGLIVTMLCLPSISHAALQTYTDEAAFIAAVGSPQILIDFDTDLSSNAIPDTTPIDQQYLPVGVDFNPFNGGSPIARNLASVSSPNSLQTVPTTGGGGGFEAVFTPLVTAIGLQIIDHQGPALGDSIWEIFDASGSSLASYNLSDEIGEGPFISLFFGVQSSSPISKLQISISANDYIAFDDMRYQPVPVPVPVPTPGTLILLVSGLLGFFGFGWRKMGGVT